MRGLECYYRSSFSDSWGLETRNQKLVFKNPSPISWFLSDRDYPLSCFEDFFFDSNKWFTQMEPSFKAIELVTKTTPLALKVPLGKTISKLRCTAVQNGRYSFAEQVAEIQYDHDDFLHDLTDRIAAMEVAFEKIIDFKVHKKAPISPKTVEKSFKKEWDTQDGRKAKISYKYEAKSQADGEFKAVKTEKYKLSNGKKASESTVKVIPLEEEEEEDATIKEATQKIQTVFARNSAQLKGKQKEMSPMDAALIIQARFREYLINRSLTLRSLRDLAVAKAKLKDLRSLFTNYAYRRHLCRDAEEKQRFTEKLIVLLLTVDSIEGSDRFVREARRSMVQELESMLDTIDPQSNKGECSRRRKFDLPDAGCVHKEMEMEVAEVVGVLNEHQE